MVTADATKRENLASEVDVKDLRSDPGLLRERKLNILMLGHVQRLSCSAASWDVPRGVHFPRETDQTRLPKWGWCGAGCQALLMGPTPRLPSQAALVLVQAAWCGCQTGGFVSPLVQEGSLSC